MGVIARTGPKEDPTDKCSESESSVLAKNDNTNSSVITAQ